VAGLPRRTTSVSLRGRQHPTRANPALPAPYSYFGSHVDTRVKPRRPDLVATAIVPDYALGPHTASLGLAHSRGTSLTNLFDNAMFIGQHGSWNRQPRSGHKVISVPYKGGKPAGMPIDVLTGFVTGHGQRERAAGG
jgi:glucose/arabinose dehydrogenase